MRPILAFFLVLALVGSCLANLKERPLRKRSADQAKRGVAAMADEAKQDYMNSKMRIDLGQRQLAAMRKKYADLAKPAASKEKMTKLRDRMAERVKNFSSQQKKLANSYLLKDRLQKSLKMRPEI